jgi:hypothetical protein
MSMKQRIIPELSGNKAYAHHLGLNVQVYFNLRKKLFSVQHKGRVLFHTRAVALKECLFKVSEAGRQRVLRENRKNVHAKIHGTLVFFDYDRVSRYAKPARLVSYNPYENESFVTRGWNAFPLPVTHSDIVHITTAGVLAIST